MSTETVAQRLGFSAEQAKALEDACIGYGIDTELRKSHFLAQVAHESGAGRYMREIWGPTEAQKKYEGRKDLGNVQPGDGVKFKGRGLIQVTGRANYMDYSMDEYGDYRAVEHPEILEHLPDAALCAGWFWKRKQLNKWADQDDIREVTRRINGGFNGLAERESYLTRAKAAFASLKA